MLEASVLPLGPIETNCYILDLGKRFLVIDPGYNSEKLLNLVSSKPSDIFLTHGHYDHIGGVRSFCERYKDAKIFTSVKTIPYLKTPELNLSSVGIQIDLSDLLDKVVTVSESEPFKYSDNEFKILEIPGHTQGCIGLYDSASGSLFSGDALFYGSIGRTDFPGGNRAQLIDSIKRKILPLPSSTRVYPGHGPSTTVGNEKKINPFIQ